jgi:O-antigen ligase
MGGAVGAQEVSLTRAGLFDGHASTFVAVGDTFALATRLLAIALGATIPISTSATEVVLILLLVCWLLSGDYLARFRAIGRNRVAVLAVVMFGVYLIGLSYSPAPLPEAANALWKYRKLLYIPVLVTVFADPWTRRHALRAFILAMLVTLAASFLVSWGLLASRWGNPSDCAVFKNHIAQNTLMAFFVGVLANRACCANRLRWLYAGITLLAAYNVLFMVTGRTGHLILFALVCLLMYQRKGLRGLAWAAVLVAGVAAVTYNLSDGFRRRVNLTMQEAADYYYWQNDSPDSSVGRRLAFYRTSALIALHRPILGTGTGSFRVEFKKLPENQGKSPSANPHSVYFGTLVQVGLLGLGLLLYWLYVQWIYSRRLPPELATLARAVVVTLAVGGLVNSLISSTAEGWLYCYFTAFCFAGLCETAPSSAQQSAGADSALRQEVCAPCRHV